ncbi:DUF1990 family protein [Cellulomonas sp. HZM]|uniref:DUF1990 family protein n=1 Tax=Cellulomonas sp. HZM TaxID=1454010 RepID=UPI000A424A1E|nr:DUF1990 family protein [Cellulomonas sp. HZM]
MSGERARGGLAERGMTSPAGSLTTPGAAGWDPPGGWRAHERTVVVGSGDRFWEEARVAVLRWEVKTRSGFRVLSDGPVVADERTWVLAELGPVVVREPVRVVAVVDTDDRCGFAYGTLDGHPVSGEEAFVVHRDRTGDDAGTVRLTLRSCTRAGRAGWRLAFPAILIAQRWYRRRYARALATG